MSKKISTANWFYKGIEETIIDIIDNICYNEKESYETSISKVIRVCAGVYAQRFVDTCNYSEWYRKYELDELHRKLKDLVFIYYKDKDISMRKVMVDFKEMIKTTHNGTFNEFSLPKKLNCIGVTSEQIKRMYKFIRNYSCCRKLAIYELKNRIDM